MPEQSGCSLQGDIFIGLFAPRQKSHFQFVRQRSDTMNAQDGLFGSRFSAKLGTCPVRVTTASLTRNADCGRVDARFPTQFIFYMLFQLHITAHKIHLIRPQTESLFRYGQNYSATMELAVTLRTPVGGVLWKRST